MKCDECGVEIDEFEAVAWNGMDEPVCEACHEFAKQNREAA